MRSLILAAFFVGVFAGASPAQISPGELAEPHAFLEGMKNCLKCHKLGAGPSAEKCLECHQEINLRVQQQKGFHYVTMKDGAQTCFSCHSDHAGRQFRLVNWPGGRDNFDHVATGWPLEGAHSKTRCRDCHTPDHIQSDLKAHRDNINMKTTFLGLDTQCVICHQDEHRGQLNDDCTGCHNVHGFDKAPGFDHARTKYALTGAHRTVSCDRCHKTEADKKGWDKDNRFTRFSPVKHGGCENCHANPHDSPLGKCADCHSTGGWMQVAEKNFDHSRTRYPLVGRHATVACDRCHGEKPRSASLRFDACTACHEDTHKGQFAGRPDGGRCESCHDANGFTPASFSVAEHDMTQFPLQGAHLAQPCVGCHVQVRTAGGDSFERFRFSRTDCEACHVDEHQGQFAPRACDDCHTVDKWRQVDFVHNRDSSYKLEGEHLGVRCSGCHVTVASSGHSFVRYKPIDTSCQTCHTDRTVDVQLGDL